MSVAVRVLVVLGGVLAALGLLAGHANRHLLDGPVFAQHVDEIRTDDAVRAALGRSISDQIIRANPDLVALRPLVEEVATRVAGSELLSGPTRVAAQATHRALTDGDVNSVALRIVDAGAVATAVVAAVAPERASAAADLSVTLAAIGNHPAASATVGVTGAVGILAWLLPLAALVSFGAAIGLAGDRWRMTASVGRSLVGAAAVVGVVLVVGGFVVRRLDDSVLAGAVTQAAWATMVRPLWWGVAVVAAAGFMTILASDSSSYHAVANRAAQTRASLLGRPRHRAGVVIRALVVALIGIAAVVDPLGLIEPVIVAGGVLLVLFAISELARPTAAVRGEPTTGAAATGAAASGPRRATRPAALAVVAIAALAVVAGVMVLSRPGDDIEIAGTGAVCNGHAELCDRRFDEVAYVATHNSMSAATEPGWFLAEQSDAIPVQLDQGVRALLIDVWSGRSARRVVRTAEGSYQEALQIAEEELGPEVVTAALRVADSIAGVAEGPEARYLCHGLCETGSTPFLDVLDQLRGWLSVNPDEVVTLFIEDHVDASLIAADVEAAGLLTFVHEPTVGAPWPTLREMITSGKRVVIMLEAGSGGAEAPWLVNGFEHTQETPFTFPTVESFSCQPNRGPADAPLLLLNHWLFGFTSLITDAELVNARDALLTRAEQCWDERGQIPNFVAVNFVTVGDVFEVVDYLNGVRLG